MAGFTTKINLLQDSIFIRELKVKHFKVLLKTLLGDEPNVEDVFQNLADVLTTITPYSINDLRNVSIIDFLLIVLYIRCISIGNTIKLEVTNETKTQITLDLYKVIETLKTPINFTFTQKIDNLKIKYKLISINDFLFNSNTDNELSIIKNYISKIYFTDFEYIDIANLNDDDFLQLFKALPASYGSIIFKHITELIKKINKINLLKHLASKNISLFFNTKTFTFILQILFSKNLFPLYENIFALAKFAGISPEYIEECTPGEYTIFVKLLERILKEQTAQQKVSNSLPPINNDNPNFM